MQGVTLDLNKAVGLLHLLSEYVQWLRCSTELDKFEKYGKELSKCEVYKKEVNTVRKRKQQFDEGTSEEVLLLAKDEFRVNVLIAIIDQLKAALAHRSAAYSDVANRFGFTNNLQTLTCMGVIKHCDTLAAHYSNDIEVSLGEEMVQFRSYAITQMNSDDTKTSEELLMYRILLNDVLVKTFPNVAVAFRIYFSLMVANCTGKRSFLQLKRIKNECRTRINQERLDMLSLMCIESEVPRQLSFDDVVEQFARQKCRKLSND